MAMQFAIALDLPLERRNELLLAAGFAPLWTKDDERALPSTLLDAIHRMMAKQEPTHFTYATGRVTSCMRTGPRSGCSRPSSGARWPLRYL
jgi:hypothetical protein